MTARSRAAAIASLAGAVWGCGANTDTTGALLAVTPSTAYNDSSAAIAIEGGPFRPAYRFDTTAGASNAEVGAYAGALTPVDGAAPPIALANVSWLSVGVLAATVPAGVPAGIYDVDVSDPRGRHAVLGGAFTSLGPDQQAPNVAIVAPPPGNIIGAGTTVTVTVAADDGDGLLATLTATVSPATSDHPVTCTVPPATRATMCHFAFTAPAPAGDGDLVRIDAQATDDVGNVGSALQASFRLAPRPTIISLSPTLGPASGGTDIDVTGTDFVVPVNGSDGTQLLIGGVVVESAEVLGPTLIHAVTPRHDAGAFSVQVSTGGAASDPHAETFEFYATPIVRMVSPAAGPLSGGTPIAVVGNNFRGTASGTITQITIGNVGLVGARFISANRIEGTLPPATTPGLVDVSADDPQGGTGVLSGAFTYDPIGVDSPDGGSTDPGSPS